MLVDRHAACCSYGPMATSVTWLCGVLAVAGCGNHLTEPTDHHAGYRLMQTGEIKLAVWYPTAAEESSFAYTTDLSSEIAIDAPIDPSQRWPLVVFSHGLTGCGIQSVFLTETLARAGYVVVAPDHRDALCTSDGAPNTRPASSGPSFLDPNAWSDQSYVDRHDDIIAVLDAMLGPGELASAIDPARVAMMGHSLGGYTAHGITGAWSTWKDARVKSALLLSPYLQPYLTKATVAQVHAPLMFQGAEGDVFITPTLEGSAGVYALANAPKYFLKLRGGDHFTWTNAVCGSHTTVTSCLTVSTNAALITNYAIAFFEKTIGDEDPAILGNPDPALSAWQAQQN